MQQDQRDVMRNRMVVHRRFGVLGVCMLTLIGMSNSSLCGADLAELLSAVRSVDSGAQGNAQATAAWKQVAQAKARDLPSIFAAMDGASPLAANWIRSAIDAIGERELSSGGQLPLKALERFLLDTRHDPRARRLAYEWILRVDKTATDRLIPEMWNDPSVEFRRDAVARLISNAEGLLQQGRKPDALVVFQQAMNGARDKDQVDTVAKQLRGLGQQVDLPRHFGFLMNWHVIGPFDNTDRTGFGRIYPPEQTLDANAQVKGKNDLVKWRPFSTKPDYGMVDLNQPFGKLKETVGYAWTQFPSEREQQVQLRLGCKNAWKLWLNGKLVFEREEYHRGMRLDQYLMPVTLKSGSNDILLKLCQNEQEESWTVEWQFQLRVCDPAGTAIAAGSRDQGAATRSD